MILNRTITLMTFVGAFVCANLSTLRAQSGSSTGSAAIDPATHAQHVAQQAQSAPMPAQEPNASVVQQLAEMRARIAQLEAALTAAPSTQRAMGSAMAPMTSGTGRAMPASAGMTARTSMSSMGAAPMQAAQQNAATSGMAGMNSGAAGGMSMMDMMKGMMSGMGGGSSMSGMPSGGGAAGMGGMSGMGPTGGAASGMMGQMMEMGMSRMGAMPQSGMQTSALPGFPGATHVYHVGATGFFLDHAEHITLSTDQQVKLNTIKETALLEQATLERKIEQAEQELWNLTGSDAPDATKIETKAREVEQVRTDQRIAFIRAVGRAATILTDDQRKQLTGLMPPMPTPQPATPPASSGSMSGMSDM